MKTHSPNFGNYEKSKVAAEKTVKYVFSGLEGRPTLTVKPAGEVNEAFLNDNLRKSKKLVRRMSRGSAIDSDMVRDNREKSYKLYPQHIIVGWKNVVDNSTPPKSVEFSLSNCEGFLRAIPIDMFDDLREFCVTMDNFRDDDDIDEESKEILGKN